MSRSVTLLPLVYLMFIIIEKQESEKLRRPIEKLSILFYFWYFTYLLYKIIELNDSHQSKTKPVLLISVLSSNEQTFLKNLWLFLPYEFLTLEDPSAENTGTDTGVETLNFPFPLPLLLHPRRNQRQTKKSPKLPSNAKMLKVLLQFVGWWKRFLMVSNLPGSALQIICGNFHN